MTNTPIENVHTKIAVGHLFIGDWTNNIASFVTDIHDTELRCSIFLFQYKTHPEFHEQINTPEMDDLLEQLKLKIKNLVGVALNIDTRREERHQYLADKQKKAQQAYDTKKSFEAMHKPAPEGTVDEIAKRFNVSKSEVRRLKREGKLSELTNG